MTSTIANSVSTKYNKQHPTLDATDPDVLMAGFRAAGWTCGVTIILALLIAAFGMRGIGLIGQHIAETDAASPTSSQKGSDIEMAPRHQTSVHSTAVQETADVNSVMTVPGGSGAVTPSEIVEFEIKTAHV